MQDSQKHSTNSRSKNGYYKNPIKGKILDFKVITMKNSLNHTIYCIIDSEGFTCGFYDSLNNANKALPLIANNVKHGKVFLGKNYRAAIFNSNYRSKNPKRR